VHCTIIVEVKAVCGDFALKSLAFRWQSFPNPETRPGPYKISKC